ncbi:MAG: hypothetical protein OEY93_10230 [Anaerolineae bacterium]|nr:hypothetical protein [Anaerolineae bacterium]
MKKLVFSIFIALLILSLAAQEAAATPPPLDKKGCKTIQSGELYGSDGSLLTTGYNEWGYNYQALMYNGLWCDYHPVYRPGGALHDWCMANMADVNLMMKWDQSWLSNVDCNDDGLLDRSDPYNGSGAWLTNHERASYIGSEGQSCQYEYFVKIVAAPADAYNAGGVWYAADGTMIGDMIWGAFAIIQEVYNDPCSGFNGLQFNSPARSGVGNW